MKLIISSPSRLAHFLGKENTNKQRRQTPTEIRYGLSLIGDREWSKIVITQDVKREFYSMLKRYGMGHTLDRHVVEIHTEDDIPEPSECDYLIIVHGDHTLTTASFDVAKAA